MCLLGPAALAAVRGVWRQALPLPWPPVFWGCQPGLVAHVCSPWWVLRGLLPPGGGITPHCEGRPMIGVSPAPGGCPAPMCEWCGRPDLALAPQRACALASRRCTPWGLREGVLGEGAVVRGARVGARILSRLCALEAVGRGMLPACPAGSPIGPLGQWRACPALGVARGCTRGGRCPYIPGAADVGVSAHRSHSEPVLCAVGMAGGCPLGGCPVPW